MESMVIEKGLIRCVQCNAVAMVTPFDQTPEYTRVGGNWEIAEMDDRARFLEKHEGHRLEELRILQDSFISRQDYLEPVKTAFFEATNGKEFFVIKRERKSISEPQIYELIQGRLIFTPTDLRIDKAGLQEELEKEFPPPSLISKKIKYFVKELQRAVSLLDAGSLKRVPFEGSNPSVWYYYIGEGTLEEVFTHSSEMLSKAEAKAIRAFLTKNLQADPVFWISARVNFTVVREMGEGRRPQGTIQLNGN